MPLKTLKPRIAEFKKESSAGVVVVKELSRWGSNRGGRPWRRIRERILVRDNYTCQYCGYIGSELEVDHILNIAQGGSDNDENLQSLCVPCHQKKSNDESKVGR